MDVRIRNRTLLDKSLIGRAQVRAETDGRLRAHRAGLTLRHYFRLVFFFAVFIFVFVFFSIVIVFGLALACVQPVKIFKIGDACQFLRDGCSPHDDPFI
jgi:hypothetical protein